MSKVPYKEIHDEAYALFKYIEHFLPEKPKPGVKTQIFEIITNTLNSPVPNHWSLLSSDEFNRKSSWLIKQVDPLIP